MINLGIKDKIFSNWAIDIEDDLKNETSLINFYKRLKLELENL